MRVPKWEARDAIREPRDKAIRGAVEKGHSIAEVAKASGLKESVVEEIIKKERQPPTSEQFEELKEVLPKPHADLDH